MLKHIKWEDESSYSRGERGKIPPTILTTTIEEVKIIIHRHICHPGTWFLTCYDMNIEKQDLHTDDFNTAVSTARDNILNKIYKYTQFRDRLLEK